MLHPRNACILGLVGGLLCLGTRLAEPAVAESRVEPLADSERAISPGKRPLAQEDLRSLRLAITDLFATFAQRYPKGQAYLEHLAALEKRFTVLPDDEAGRDRSRLTNEFLALRQEALLANPLLDFDKLLFVKRRGQPALPMNWQGNSSLPRTGHDNEIAVLSPMRPEATPTTIYRPEGGRFVGDLDLHFDADRLLFSMLGANGRWQVHELGVDGTGLRELPLIHEPDVDNYDACYLPDGRIVFTSTAPFVGVPCVRGASHVANLYLLNADGSIRQLTVDQEHNWCPTVSNDGRILFQRWEYSDTPHAFNRLLFQMNPDGTGQMACYGSNSYWPNAMFYARPVPDHMTRVVAVVGGHHGDPRMGELVLFDTAQGRFEADGVVQRIPGYKRPVEPILKDQLVDGVWPKFLHPYPLSDKYFIVSCRPRSSDVWGIYLVDVFDNFLLLYSEPDYSMLEPTPVRKIAKPPQVADKVDLARKDATVLIADVYRGGGLKGIPRGTVKSLRVIAYHYCYQGVGGQVDRVGLDGPWDVKSVLGTVPVYEDGSAHFRIPAYKPIAVQPLDAEGKAVQLMRSWFTAMPSEELSCVGCHEPQDSTPTRQPPIAAARTVSEIKPWYGPARGFSFRREVQPVLDRHCIRCHNEQARESGLSITDLTDRPDVHPQSSNGDYNRAAHFSPSYMELKRFVRNASIESDSHMLAPRDFHADTMKLVQLLSKGHYDVVLDTESWDRIITWIDLNTPAHGTWTEVCGGPDRVVKQNQRRRQMQQRYTGMSEQPEVILNPYRPVEVATVSAEVAASLQRPKANSAAGGPKAGDKSASDRPGNHARKLQTESILLADDMHMQMVRVPEGRFVMGDAKGYDDEKPPHPVTIDRPFWIGCVEVTNEQYSLFDPIHDSGVERGDFLQFNEAQRGASFNGPTQPVVRVSWDDAMAFCRWLSGRTGRRFTLPTEAQWEYACRADTATPLWYGTVDDDFSPFANVSDASNRAVTSGVVSPWRPIDGRYNDGMRVSAPAGRYGANPWGLHDMHGNVAEWTRSDYRVYSPLGAADGDPGRSLTVDRKVVRGGSWDDRPRRCRSAVRFGYAPDQVVFNVGFRVIREDNVEAAVDAVK